MFENKNERRVGVDQHKRIIFAVILVLIFTGFVNVRAQGQFVGSINSNIYHYPSCQYAQNIIPANQIWFVDADDALSHGYKPCAVCNPPVAEFPSGPVFVLLTATLCIAILARRELSLTGDGLPKNRD
jgi:hypothetical protein